MTAQRIHAYMLLLFVSFIWGAAVVIIKYTLGGIAPLPFLSYRLLISAIIGAIALLLFRYPYPKSGKTWFAITIYSFLSTTFSLGFLFLGLNTTTVLNITILSLAAPLIAQYAGVVFLHEKISKREKIGTGIAAIGTIITLLEPLLENGLAFGGLTGNILVLTYLVGDIASVILLKKMLKEKIDPIMLTNVSFVIGLLTLLPITIVFLGIPQFANMITTLPVEYHLGVLYMAIFSGTIAYALRAKAQKAIDVGEASLFAYITPLFSAPLALIFLKEEITPLFVIGGIIVAIGVVIAEWRKRR
jgi:drug/metabolite transporter (DMT)-like permease